MKRVYMTYVDVKPNETEATEYTSVRRWAAAVGATKGRVGGRERSRDGQERWVFSTECWDLPDGRKVKVERMDAEEAAWTAGVLRAIDDIARVERKEWQVEALRQGLDRALAARKEARETMVAQRKKVHGKKT